MPDNSFGLFVITGVIISIVVGRINKFIVDPNAGLWTPKKMEVKGGKLELKAEP